MADTVSTRSREKEDRQKEENYDIVHLALFSEFLFYPLELRFGTPSFMKSSSNTLDKGNPHSIRIKLFSMLLIYFVVY